MCISVLLLCLCLVRFWVHDLMPDMHGCKVQMLSSRQRKSLITSSLGGVTLQACILIMPLSMGDPLRE